MIKIKQKTIKVGNSEITIPVICDWWELYYSIWRKWSRFEYHIRKIFKPWNVLRIQHLENEYVDRDYMMFHAIFQCLVDFVELEHDLVPWEIRRNTKGRFTDIKVMHEFILSQLTPEGLASYHASWDSDEDKLQTDIRTHEVMRIKTEILYLYAWYKMKKYELDSELIFHVDLEDISRSLGLLNEKRPKSEYYLTSKEHTEIEEEHRNKCDHMLRRVLAVRHYLWT